MTTLTLQPDAAAGDDTWLDQLNVASNNGINPILTLIAGANGANSLIRFVLSAIPAAATCISATLTLTTTSAIWGNWACAVHTIKAANGDWIEGTKNAAQAAAGEPCWNAKEADGAGGVTTAWAGSAGCETSGTDYDAVAIGTWSGLNNEAAGTQHAISLTPAAVQAWFGLANNDGMLLRRVTNVWKGDSSDSVTAGERPELEVVYSLPGGLLTLGVG